jgi:DNA mismatch endonuclease (patch repair protein)
VADIFTKKKRSEIMSRIRCAATKPEQRLVQMVRRILGYRWRIEQNVQSLPGRPDIVVPSLSLIIFLDGCFYHGCPAHGHRPKSNKKYWIPKLKRNKERDDVNRRLLRKMGFTVVRFWEHDLQVAQLPKTERALNRGLTSSKAKYLLQSSRVHQEKRVKGGNGTAPV